MNIQFYGATVGMIIESPEGEIVISDGMYNDPQVPLYQFPMTGTYTITLMTGEPGGTDIGFWIFKREPIPVTTNESTIVEIEEGLPTVFAFDTPAGKMWDINATLPQNGDRFLAIYQFDGERAPWEAQIDRDEGNGPDGQPRIRPFIPTDDGTYYLALWYDDYSTEYEVYEAELIVSPSTLLSIAKGSPITGEINSETGAAQYAYTAKAGDEILVTFTKLSDEGELSLSIYSSEDEVITFMGRNATRSTFSIELPLDGFYEFVIRNASYDESSTLAYELLVEPLTK